MATSRPTHRNLKPLMSLTGTLRIRHFRPTQICSHSPGIKIEDDNSMLRISCCAMLDRLCLCLRDNHDLFLDILQRLAICNGSGAGAGLHLNWIFSYPLPPCGAHWPPKQHQLCPPRCSRPREHVSKWNSDRSEWCSPDDRLGVLWGSFGCFFWMIMIYI